MIGYVAPTDPDWYGQLAPRVFRPEESAGREPGAPAMIVMPSDRSCHPGPEFLRWHNDHVYRG